MPHMLKTSGYIIIYSAYVTSSYTIDMTFKVTVVNKFSENVLHKGRNGAGVKAER